MRYLSPALLFAIALSSSLAPARDWTTTWNEVVAKGDFVRRLGSNVEIKTSTGRIVTISIGNLNRDDQLYVLQQTLEQNGQPPTEPKLTATASWDEAKPTTGKPAERTLLVTIVAQGKELANASRVGDVEIDEFTTNTGASLDLAPNSNAAPGTMDVVDHESATAPPHGLSLQLRFTPGKQPISQIARLRGSFKIVTGEPQTITVTEPAKAKDRVLDDPLLTELGVKIVVNPTGKSANSLSLINTDNQTVYQLKVSGQNDRILRIMPTDADGRWHFAKSAAHFGSGAEYFHQYTFTPPGPKDLQFRITLLVERSEERIPFDFSDLTVPQPK